MTSAPYRASPRCARCGGRAVWIGIGPGAEPACARECAGRCPRCLSDDVAPFVVPRYFPGMWFGSGDDDEENTAPDGAPAREHCNACGAVWEVSP